MVREDLCMRYVEWRASPPPRDRTIHVAKPHGVRGAVLDAAPLAFLDRSVPSRRADRRDSEDLDRACWAMAVAQSARIAPNVSNQAVSS